MNTYFSVIGIVLVSVLSFGSIACGDNDSPKIDTGITTGSSGRSIDEILRDFDRKTPGNNERNIPINDKGKTKTPKNETVPLNKEPETETSANEIVPVSTERISSDMPFYQLVTVSRNLLDEFWMREFNTYGRRYQTARGFYFYNQPPNTPCGVLELNNAYYCPSNHSVYYDDRFLRKMYRETGDFAAVTVLAHEWGHLVQANLGIMPNSQKIYSIQTELQADCFAGAFAGYLNRKGMLEDYDLDEGGANLFSLGDLKGTPWFDAQAHGKPIARIDAYLEGYKRGSRQCFSYTQTRQRND